MLFKEQIEKRTEQEQRNLHEAVDRLADDLGLQSKLQHEASEQRHAVRDVLEALGITGGYELDEEDPLFSVEEQLARILRPHGIMYRKVKLEGRWWREAQGPMLGRDKQGKWVALLPANAYGNVRQIRKELAEEAICFFPALPMRKITLKDLLRFMLRAFTLNDTLKLFLVSSLVAVLGMLIPYASKQIFDNIIPNGTQEDILPIAALLVGGALGSVLFGVIRGWILKRMKELVSIRIEPAVMARTFLLKAGFFMKYASGELNERIMSIGKLCNQANNLLVSTALSALFSVVYVFQMQHYAPELVATGMTVIALQFVLMCTLFWFQRRRDKKIITTYTKLSALMFDQLNGIQKIKITGSEKRAFTRWLQTYRENARQEYNPPLLLKLSSALLAFINLGGTALVYFTAVQSALVPSDFIAFNAAYGMVAGAFGTLIGIVPQMARMQPLLEQAEPIMDALPENDVKAKQALFLSGSIEVSHLSFRYSEDMPWILDDFNLKVQPGEYIGVVGKSGCGKSTLLRLLLGFETPQTGTIFYDDYDLNDTDKSSLRRHFGTCLQSGTLFPGDVFSNITITAPWSSRDDAWEAARLAGIDQDIKALPMGMSTLISEGGSGFSGGQKQRLLIARALLNRPSILFFDEATSALDNVSQKRVADNLAQMGCTRFVIAHRLSTIRHCDRIIVLDKGRIVEEGTFEELKARGGLFAEMIKRQEM